MRSALPALLLLAACNPGVSPPRNEANETVPVRNRAEPAPATPANAAEVAPINEIASSSGSEPEAMPGLAGMSPYRRREFERGWRDCMTGNFDGERQGESYRIGCMAAEDTKQRRSGR